MPTQAMPLPMTKQQPWPLQQGQPLREAKYSQQQCKCNRRQLGTEPKTPGNAQMC